MNEITKKVWKKVLTSPGVVLPAVGGLSALIFSTIFISLYLSFMGVIGLVASGGILVTKIILQSDSLVQKVYAEQEKVKIVNKQNEINALMEKLLTRTRSKRDDKCLESLVVSYDRFLDAYEKFKDKHIINEAYIKAEALFNVSIEQLKKSLDLIPPNTNNNQWNKVMTDVEKTVEILEEMTGHMSITPIESGEAERLQEELAVSMRAALLAQQRIESELSFSKDLDKLTG